MATGAGRFIWGPGVTRAGARGVRTQKNKSAYRQQGGSQTIGFHDLTNNWGCFWFKKPGPLKAGLAHSTNHFTVSLGNMKLYAFDAGNSPIVSRKLSENSQFDLSGIDSILRLGLAFKFCVFLSKFLLTAFVQARNFVPSKAFLAQLVEQLIRNE